MFRLHGVSVSNYYMMVKLALLEKGLEFEEVSTYPSQEPGYLAKSPMGKIPCLEVREGFLSETSAILEFLEDTNPEIPLMPRGDFHKAKVRELIKVCELYIEIPMRELYGAVFFGGELDQHRVKQIRPLVERGLSALERLARFEPYLAGHEFTYADIFAYYTLYGATVAAKEVYQWDIVAEVDGLADWRNTMADRSLVQSINTELKQALASIN